MWISINVVLVPSTVRAAVSNHTHDIPPITWSSSNTGAHTRTGHARTLIHGFLKRGTGKPVRAAPVSARRVFWLGTCVCVLIWPQEQQRRAATRRLVEASRIGCTLGGSSSWSSGTAGRATPALVAPRPAPRRARLRTQKRHPSHDLLRKKNTYREFRGIWQRRVGSAEQRVEARGAHRRRARHEG